MKFLTVVLLFQAVSWLFAYVSQLRYKVIVAWLVGIWRHIDTAYFMTSKCRLETVFHYRIFDCYFVYITQLRRRKKSLFHIQALQKQQQNKIETLQFLCAMPMVSPHLIFYFKQWVNFKNYAITTVWSTRYRITDSTQEKYWNNAI